MSISKYLFILLCLVTGLGVLSCTNSTNKSKKNEKRNQVESLKTIEVSLEDKIDQLNVTIDSLNAANEIVHLKMTSLYDIGVRSANERSAIITQFSQHKTTLLKQFVDTNFKYGSEYDSLENLMNLGISNVLSLTKQLDSLQLLQRKEILEKRLTELKNGIK